MEEPPAPVAEPPTPLCGRHPERVAVATCARCGTFVCDDCAAGDDERGRMCPDCGPRFLRYRIPWEAPTASPLQGFARTWRAIVTDAPGFFARLPDGNWTQPATFFAVSWFVAMIVFAVIKLLLGVRDAPGAFVAIPCATPLVPLGPALYSLLLHGVARVAGGSGTLETTTRATLYASALLVPAWVAPELARFLPPPVAGGIAIVLYVTAVLLSARAVAWYFRGRMGLSGPRAWLAAIAPPVVLFGGLCGTGLLYGLVRAVLARRHGH